MFVPTVGQNSREMPGGSSAPCAVPIADDEPILPERMAEVMDWCVHRPFRIDELRVRIRAVMSGAWSHRVMESGHA